MTFRPDLILSVSDHALVRFMERVAGIDLSATRLAVQAGLNRAVQAADDLGSKSFTVKADGMLYVVKDGVLVTILDQKKSATSK